MNNDNIVSVCWLRYYIHLILQVPKSFLTEPNKLNDCLPIKEQIFHKLTIPDTATSRNDDNKTKIT